ncbi:MULTISPECIES: hypothetical protein [Aquimarina]|uniref:hypothetical protein n=1 Tax=Aquimarina TaxID=290174 RepID=UPI0004B50CCE|nr:MULTISPECIES: hypothetical protein [Aquimarina]
MLKNIVNLNGVDQLKRDEQAFIKGGIKIDCNSDADCPFLWPVCSNNGHCIRG